MVTAVTAMVIPPTATPPTPVELNAVRAFPGKVTIAPSTNRNPAMDSVGIYLPIFGSSPADRMIARKDIMSTPYHKGCGAPPVAEMIDSTGPPPNREDGRSARPLIIDRWSILTGVFAISPVIFPKEILEPMLRVIMARAPRRILKLKAGFMNLIFSLSMRTKSDLCPITLDRMLVRTTDMEMV